MDISIQKFILRLYTNFLINTLVFKRSNKQFPQNKQVFLSEFATTYKGDFFKKVIPKPQMQVEKGGLIKFMRLLLHKLKKNSKI